MPLRDDESRRAGGSSMALRAAFPATIPVMTGFLCLGTAYGLLMQSKGYGPGWSVLMSAIAFGGSMQFVAVTLLTTAFDPVQAFLLSVMVNARHMFYGLSLLDKYKGLGKVLLPHGLFTDRDGKGQCLARAGLGTGSDIPPIQGRRDHGFLDRCRRRVSLECQCVKDGLR